MLFKIIIKSIMIILTIIFLIICLTNVFVTFYLLPVSLIFVILPTILLILIDYNLSKYLSIRFNKLFIRYIIYGSLIGFLFGLLVFKDMIKYFDIRYDTFIMCVFPPMFLGIICGVIVICLLKRKVN